MMSAIRAAAWLYEAALVWLIVHSVAGDGARAALASVYPSLGVPPPERSYGDACDATSWAVVRSALVDVFTPAHLALWWALALVLRDARLCWAGSLLFELGEITFQHWLPNFHECWWDRVLLDVLICNGRRSVSLLARGALIVSRATAPINPLSVQPSASPSACALQFSNCTHSYSRSGENELDTHHS